MTRTRHLPTVPALSLAAATRAAPASACCHPYELEQRAGPCVARWEGDLCGGLQTDRVSLACAGHGVAVENPVPGPREGGFPWDALP